MTRFIARLAFLLIGAIAPALSQSTAPAPAKPLQASPAPVQTIRANAQLVVVDVVVTDRSGNPIHGLKASNFALTENGVLQTVKSFEEHTAPAVPIAPEPPPPPGIFTNKPPVPPGGAVNILLLDSLNTPTSDQSYLHQQLLSYLKSATPGARTAIFGLSDHLVLLQGFNDDPAVLRKLLTQTNPTASPVRTDQTGSGIQESAADAFEDSQDPMFAELAANLHQWEAQQQSVELQTRAKYTLDAFNQLARSLAAIPGRKNLLWFSASFPLNVLPDTTNNQVTDPDTPANDNFLNPFASVADVADEFRETIDRLSRSQIAVYPIDVRGVQQTSVYDADTTRNYTGNRGARRFSADQNQFVSDMAAENGTMTSLAAATGGHAYIGTNDLSRAVKDSIDQGANFYSLSYSPTDSNLDGKLRKIKVQLAHSGYTLSYRQGYYADPPDPIKTSGVLSPSSAGAPNDPVAASIHNNLRLAMTRGGPQPTDILFRVGVVPITQPGESEPTVAANNTPTAKSHGPWRRYSVNYQIDPAGLVFYRQPDGKVRTDFDLIVFVYTAQGDLLNSFHRPLTYAGSDHDVRGFFQHGMVQHEEVSVPAKGEYFLRIAVHDLHRDHYGAIEVSTSQVANLKPEAELPAPASTPH
jgi:VWFA-related protein